MTGFLGRRVLPIAVALAVLLPIGCAPPPNGFEAGFRTETIASGLDWPTSFVISGAGDAYILEKPGIVRVIRDNQLLPTPVIDIRQRVLNYRDAGMISLALDPDFETNGYLYLAYVYEDPTLPDDQYNQTQRVTRVTVMDDVADPASEVLLLGSATGAICYENWDTEDCLPLNGFHTVDDLAFDSSGALLVSVGDGAGADDTMPTNQRVQDLDVLAGKVLRINKETGEGLPDNPFAAGLPLNTNAARVWAYGFRNPFRFSLRPGTDDVYLGDVGQWDYEELNVVRAGGNYGWPCFEGTQREPTEVNRSFCEEMYRRVDSGELTVTAPVISYDHNNGRGGAIVGGVFYTGTTYPEEYRGDYFYGDYAQEWIRRVEFDEADGTVGPSIQFADSTGSGAPSQFRMGPDGNLWYISISNFSLRRIVYDGGDQQFPASCADNQYRIEYFNNMEVAGEPVYVSCEAHPLYKRLTDRSPAPGIGVDEWSFRATGRITLDGGTYHVRSDSNDGKRVWLDGQLLVDRWVDSAGPESIDVWGRDYRIAPGTHTVTMEFYDRAAYAFARLEIDRRGTPPVVQVDQPADLLRVAPGTRVDLTASATDAEDGTIDPSAIKLDVTMLHYGGEEPHTHPYAMDQPNPANVELLDAHGANSVMFEVKARVTDSSGIPAVSEPVRICLVGGNVGPCA
jgi:glucose/arabinose dehydrogenase